MQHWAIFITNDSNKSKFIHNLLAGAISELAIPQDYKGALFSKLAIERFIDEEERHGAKTISKGIEQPLKTMSSGEQKKALLNHLFQKDYDFIVLDNPFDNLDVGSQSKLTKVLTEKSKGTVFVQIISRKGDLLSFIKNFALLDQDKLSITNRLEKLFSSGGNSSFSGSVPAPIKSIAFQGDVLIQLDNVTLSFGDKPILQNINWTIKKGEFWQLVGKNGSGKTTILSMITGENPKGYGQELFLFGKKKGSGESIWDIKKKIGYFTPAMTDRFKGYHTIENMLISGLNDSIGLYVKPTEIQLRIAKEWLTLIGLWQKKDVLFNNLSMGQKRLVMTTRAMIKHPLLLILDEPTAGLDDASAKLLVELVNKIAKESDTATIFVSHRREPGLNPDFIYELEMTDEGSRGSIKSDTIIE